VVDPSCGFVGQSTPHLRLEYDPDMGRREIGWLSIGLGFGLAFGVWAVIELFKSLERSACLFNFYWSHSIILIPLLPLLIGIALLSLKPRKPPA
jgi:hypothetical protein